MVVIDYVIAHELAHLIGPKHTPFGILTGRGKPILIKPKLGKMNMAHGWNWA